MGNSKKRLYKALNVGIFVFVEDDFGFAEEKRHVLNDFVRMNSKDRKTLLDNIPDSDDKKALVDFEGSISSWIEDIDWKSAPSDDLEFCIKGRDEILALYNAVNEELWFGECREFFYRYGVGIIIPPLYEEFFSSVIRNEREFCRVRVYKNYVEETHGQILEDIKIQGGDNSVAVLVLDNMVGSERKARQMISDLKSIDFAFYKRTYATIFSTSHSEMGESVTNNELYVGYAHKRDGLKSVDRNLVYAAINILIQKYKEYYKTVVTKKCDLLSENPELVEYIYSMARDEGAPGCNILKEWLSFMMDYETENSIEFEDLVKLSVCIDAYEAKNNKKLSIPNQLINAAAAENYFNNVNKFYTVTSPGDIFFYKDQYYVLIGQDCDYMMGDKRKRKTPICELLHAELISQSNYEKLADDSKCVYINNFKDEYGNMKVLKVNYSKRSFVSNEVLNLCCFNKQGESKIDYGAELSEDVVQMIQPYMVEYYSEIKAYFADIISIKQKIPTFFENQKKLYTVTPLINIDDYQEDGTTLEYGIQRISHLKSVACLYLYKMFLEYRGRIPYTTINLTGYSALSIDMRYNEQVYSITMFAKLSNDRGINGRNDCRQLVWIIKKNDLNKALVTFGCKESSVEDAEEYIELVGKEPLILELDELKIKMTKGKEEDKLFITLKIEGVPCS